MTAETLDVSLRREDVLHFLGYRGRGAPAPRIEAALGPVLAEARRLITPRGVHRIVSPDRAARLGLEGGSGSCLALGLVTIGFRLEMRVSELLGRGEDTHALLLDAAGSAATEEAAGELECRIHGNRGEAGRRVSPGYGTWPITAQRALFEMLPHEEIKVRLLPSCLMAPRKSVSFAVWLDVKEGGIAGGTSGAAEGCQPGRCATCDVTTCPYREGPDEREGS